MDMRTGFNGLTFLADIHMAAILPWTRSGMGTRGMGWPGFWAMLGIPLYAGLAEAPEMLAYWHVWMAMVIYRRLTADSWQHPQYQGRAWMFHWCMKRELDARLMEAGTMPLIGGILCGISEPIGLFVTAGFFSFGFRYVVDVAAHARRQEAVARARIEQEAMQAYVEEDMRRYGRSAAVDRVTFKRNEVTA